MYVKKTSGLAKLLPPFLSAALSEDDIATNSL